MYGEFPTTPAIDAAIDRIIEELVADPRCRSWAAVNPVERFAIPVGGLVDEKIVDKLLGGRPADDVCEWFNRTIAYRMVESKPDYKGRIYRTHCPERCRLLKDVCAEIYCRLTS